MAKKQVPVPLEESTADILDKMAKHREVSRAQLMANMFDYALSSKQVWCANTQSHPDREGNLCLSCGAYVPVGA